MSCCPVPFVTPPRARRPSSVAARLRRRRPRTTRPLPLTVDGNRSSVHVLGSTVGDVLDKQGITVGPHDVVVPSVATPVEDGDHVSVRYGRKLTLTVDGVTKEYWTTATTVDAALQDIGVRDRRRRAHRLPLAAARPLGPRARRDDAEAGHRDRRRQDPYRHARRRRRSRGVLGELGVSRSALDLVAPGLDTPVDDGMKIVLKRVRVATEKKTEASPTRRRGSRTPAWPRARPRSSRPVGRRSKQVVRENRYVDGKLDSSKVVSEKVLRGPGGRRRQGRHQGGPAPRPRAPATPPAPASTSPTRRCGTASPSASPAATGTSTPATATTAASSSRTTSWLANGGADFAPRADLASRERADHRREPATTPGPASRRGAAPAPPDPQPTAFVARPVTPGRATRASGAAPRRG